MDHADGGTLLVMLPALNESASLAAVIARIPREIEGLRRVDVLVVDDGSTDDTVAIAREAGAHVISHRKNRGVGAAFQTGIDEAIRRGSDILLNIDADGQFSPEDIPRLVAPIIDGQADFVTASRFKDKSLVPVMPWAKRLGNWGMARIISFLCGERFHDASCGFRAYSRDTVLRLVLLGQFTYTQETLLLMSQRGLRILELPLKIRGEREHGKSRVASNLFRYAWRTLGIIFGFIRDYSPGILFNNATALFWLASLGLGGFFFWIRLSTGQFSPHIWAGFSSAFLFGLGAMSFLLGQVATMVARLRHVQESQLLLVRTHLPMLREEQIARDAPVSRDAGAAPAAQTEARP
jgi:glycosyltransferase involved in cell wall biosynthesis